ncbi:MAG: ACP S-malonyltransferase [Candidatus Omnitrophota bacterium]
MSAVKALLFAGQGAQYVGMGRDLSAEFAESRGVFAKADHVLGFPLSGLCFEGPLEELVKTDNCQPAILAVSIAALRAFEARCPALCKEFSYTAGLSLGEYSALVAAGALSFEDAVYLVRKRGEFMEEEARKKPGKMLSVIGMEREAVRNLCADTNTEIANLNCPGQIVISGGAKEIGEAERLAKDRGAKMALLLEVSGAFHSSFMKGASDRLARELDNVQIHKPRIPVISNVTARPATTPEEIKGNLVRQVASSVLWEDSMRFILSGGASDFLEFGPGKVLKGLMRRIDGRARVVNVEKKDDILGCVGGLKGEGLR